MSMSDFKIKLKTFFQPLAVPRIMLFFPAVIFKLISSGLSTVAFVLKDSSMAIAGMVFWILWIVTLFFIALPQTDRWLAGATRWLKPVSLSLMAVLITVGAIEYSAAAISGSGVSLPALEGTQLAELLEEQRVNLAYNDATALCHQAAENLLEGKNPYAEANIVSVTLRFNADNEPWQKTTPIRTGRFADDFPYPDEGELQSVWEAASLSPQTIPPEYESRLNYPAGCFLLITPFVWMGINDLRWIYLLAVIAGLFIVVLKTPGNLRLWLIGAALASLEIWQSVASGETGALILPFMLGTWLLWKKNLWLSAICMGIAVATKQMAWFFLPFYLILVLKSMGWKKTSVVILISGGIFLAFNALFIIQDPGLWLSSVLAPMTDKFFPMGVGPASLISSGLIDIESPLVFTLLEAFSFIFALIWYWSNCQRYPHTGIILAVVPLFFAWRSSWWYFFYFDIILLAAIMLERHHEPCAESGSLALQ
jgi:hypothetical protein